MSEHGHRAEDLQSASTRSDGSTARLDVATRPRTAHPRPWVRIANAVLSALLLALFLVHGVGNAFQLIGVGSPLAKALSYVMLAALCAHLAIGCYLTIITLRAQRSAGAAYPALNRRFWAVRISGLALVALIAFHVLVFWRGSAGPVRLMPFGGFELAMHLLLAAALATHVIANVLPLLIGLGIGAPRPRAADAIFVIALLLALMSAAFIVYYLRWSVI